MKKLSNLFFLIIFVGFSQNSREFNNYWYGGKAEVTSYDLEQARYGEIRKGHAVNIFVTEPFSKKYYSKANKDSKGNITVLKLNAIKKFNTGIYPYSIMTSTFVPVSNPFSSVKISSSTQEWCGHEYIELIKKESQFNLSNFSYFQEESFQNQSINNDVVLEDDIWSKIRLTPNKLPQGIFDALPSFSWLRFSHKKVQAYKVEGFLIRKNKISIYKLKYPTLNRSLTITFENIFPYKIIGWTETYVSGWGAKQKTLTTIARLKKTLNIAYWEKNSNKDFYLREELGLE